MRFTITTTISLTKKEFQNLKDIRANEFSIEQGTINKFFRLNLIREVRLNLRNWYKSIKLTKLGKKLIEDNEVLSNPLPPINLIRKANIGIPDGYRKLKVGEQFEIGEAIIWMGDNSRPSKDILHKSWQKTNFSGEIELEDKTVIIVKTT